MGIWVSRKKAAEARMRHHRGITPPEEVKVMRAQYRIDRDEERAQMDELEVLKKEVEGEKLDKKVKAKPVAKAKPVKKKITKPKVPKKVVRKEAVEAKKDHFEKDFYDDDGGDE